MTLDAHLEPRTTRWSTRLTQLPRTTHPRLRTPRAPRPSGHVLWGNAQELSADPLAALENWHHSHGDVVRLRLGTTLAHTVTHPHDVRRVLQDNHTNYNKQTRGYGKLKVFLGEGLLTSDGSLWKRQRRLAQPAFMRQRIAALADVVVDAAEETLTIWRRYAARGQPFDVAAEMMRVTLSVVGRAMFGVDLGREANQVQDAIRFIQRDSGRRIHGVFDWPLAIPTKNNVQLARSIRTLDEILMRVISERRRDVADGKASSDLLGMLLEACGDERMSDQQLRDELMTMLLAGHESTANALSWCWYLLSSHGDVRDRMTAEIRTVIGNRRPTFADLVELRYTSAVVKETMRLYPPAWSMGRTAIEDDTLGGFHIPAGSLVILAPYVTHRHPAFWDAPTKFDPNRFLGATGRGDDRPDSLRRGYFPFGGGPRVCIGKHFAMMEATLVLATLARELRLDLDVGQTVVPEPNITLRPHGSIWVKACAA